MTEKGILGIRNRTENWKTALNFSLLLRGQGHRMTERLGGESRLAPKDVKLELFWTGMRDLLFQCKFKQKVMEPKFEKLYKASFSNLRADVEAFKEFRPLRHDNYNTFASGWLTRLFNNLRNSEVDVVLETPDTLFIGEAKHEMTFGANGNLFLVNKIIC